MQWKSYFQMKKGKYCQKEFRNTVFNFDQYWIISYTEIYQDKSEKDYKTFIKSKSYDLAKNILKSKLLEGDVKIKSLQGFMLHKDYKRSIGEGISRRLDLEDWDQIKKCAYPNENDFLFKYETQRPKGYSNRFNKTNYEHLETIGFKSGPNNYSTIHRKGKHLAIEKRIGKKWNGAKWIDWDKEEMLRTEKRIIEALEISKNNRKAASLSLNMGRTQLYKVMKRIHPLSWWNENFPYERVLPKISKERRSEIQKKVMKKRAEQGIKPFCLTEEQEKKKIKI